MDVAGTPRSLEEIAFYIAETPCEACGTRGATDATWDPETGADVTLFKGACKKCGRQRVFRFGPVRDLTSAPDGVLARDPGPSQILSAAMLLGAVERDLAQVPERPPATRPDAFRASQYLRRARKALAELEKLGAGAGDPSRVAGLRARFDARWPAYSAAVGPAPAGAPAQTLAERALAHAHWVARGRTGAGRLELVDADLSGQRLGNPTLTAARLTRCKLDRVDLSMATLDHAALERCSFVEANLASANLAHAMIDGCAFARASLRLAILDDATVTGGDWRGLDAGRGFWHRTRLTGVDLRDTHLRDLVLDGAVLDGCDLRGADLRRDKEVLRRLGTARGTRFVGCDLRGARIGGWRLDDTRFERCRLDGLDGAPALEGPVTVDGKPWGSS